MRWLYFNSSVFVKDVCAFVLKLGLFWTNKEIQCHPTPLPQACAHTFFDELREPGTKLPSGRELPVLFNFTEQVGGLVWVGTGGVVGNPIGYPKPLELVWWQISSNDAGVEDPALAELAASAGSSAGLIQSPIIRLPFIA